MSKHTPRLLPTLIALPIPGLSRISSPIEIGAGISLSTIRRFVESADKGFLIRINPTNARISNAYNKQGVWLQVGALEGLRGIAVALLG